MQLLHMGFIRVSRDMHTDDHCSCCNSSCAAWASARRKPSKLKLPNANKLWNGRRAMIIVKDDKLLTTIIDTHTAVRHREKYFIPTLRKRPNEALLLVAWMLHRKSSKEEGLFVRLYLMKESCQGEDQFNGDGVVVGVRPLLTNLFRAPACATSG
jgi:hypothetical protein